MKILCIFGGRGGNSRCCRKTLKTQETKHFIDWNDILFGQKGLNNCKQDGTPYPTSPRIQNDEDDKQTPGLASCFLQHFHSLATSCSLSRLYNVRPVPLSFCFHKLLIADRRPMICGIGYIATAFLTRLDFEF
jgi:hypothetical protein